MNLPSKNTDKELWREIPDDYYSPSIHVTQDGQIGIQVGGLVIQAHPKQWIEWAEESQTKQDEWQPAQNFLRRLFKG